MGNLDKNKQFKKVCEAINITDLSQIRRFHEYLDNNYKGVSNNFSYKELLEVGREFLEFDGGVKKEKRSKR